MGRMMEQRKAAKTWMDVIQSRRQGHLACRARVQMRSLEEVLLEKVARSWQARPQEAQHSRWTVHTARKMVQR